MEASAIHAPAAVSRFPLGGPLLRLRSDEQLLALFRTGNDEAFRVLHDRYRQRLFAYVRQMLSAGSRQDAEDVLQDVFVRAYGALRNDNRDMNVRAWLYRVAHNRCIDHLRRPVPPPAEVFEVSRKPLHDPVEEAQRRDDLRRLVLDVANLPEQQRSALLMREIDGMTYADLAVALDVTVPAVKSLLVRARIGLVEAAEARDADCGEIRADLLRSYDKGVKASGRARKHMRSCDGCREYRVALRGMRRSFAALTPVGLGPIALVAKLIGFGGSAGGAAAAARPPAAVRPRWRPAARRPRPPARSPPSSARPRSRPAAPSRSTTRSAITHRRRAREDQGQGAHGHARRRGAGRGRAARAPADADPRARAGRLRAGEAQVVARRPSATPRRRPRRPRSPSPRLRPRSRTSCPPPPTRSSRPAAPARPTPRRGARRPTRPSCPRPPAPSTDVAPARAGGRPGDRRAARRR